MQPELMYNVIAMHINVSIRFLDTKHRDCYRVYNL